MHHHASSSSSIIIHRHPSSSPPPSYPSSSILIHHYHHHHPSSIIHHHASCIIHDQSSCIMHHHASSCIHSSTIHPPTHPPIHPSIHPSSSSIIISIIIIIHYWLLSIIQQHRLLNTAVDFNEIDSRINLAQAAAEAWPCSSMAPLVVDQEVSTRSGQHCVSTAVDEDKDHTLMLCSSPKGRALPRKKNKHTSHVSANARKSFDSQPFLPTDASSDDIITASIDKYKANVCLSTPMSYDVRDSTAVLRTTKTCAPSDAAGLVTLGPQCR